jgi:hypothetical protein
MSLSRWDEESDSPPRGRSEQDKGLVGHRKIPALQLAKLPRYGREGAVEVRPFPAETRPRASEAQGLSGEAMKGNPPTTVIPRVDESKSSHLTTEDLTESSIPPRRALASETIILASRESRAVRTTLSSLTGILALHLGHVLLL